MSTLAEATVLADPYPSSGISLVLSWVIAFPVALGWVLSVFRLSLEAFEEASETKGVRRLHIAWILICMLLLSPARYLLFLSTFAASYMVQSVGAFLSCLLLLLYVPILFSLLYVIAIYAPVKTMAAFFNKKREVTFWWGIAAYLVTPLVFVLWTLVFRLALSIAAWNVSWVGPSDIMRASNGAPALVYAYIVHPLDLLNHSRMLPSYFNETPQQHRDLVRCHVSYIFFSREEEYEFIKAQYPQIYGNMDSTWSPEEKLNFQHFLSACRLNQEITALGNKLAELDEVPETEASKFIDVLRRALREARLVEDAVLLKAHPDLPIKFRTLFQQGMELRLSSWEGTGELHKDPKVGASVRLAGEIEGTHLLNDWRDWLDANSTEIKVPK